MESIGHTFDMLIGPSFDAAAYAPKAIAPSTNEHGRHQKEPGQGFALNLAFDCLWIEVFFDLQTGHLQIAAAHCFPLNTAPSMEAR